MDAITRIKQLGMPRRNNEFAASLTYLAMT